ncbi:hypothetical protein J1605_006453 [Eschrichtius robustus]|uniref:CCHC-type domain-containing protein n=1 Tax=Eschrichtius robustus TaxID=9764 RepID=A0AB34H371_ESCRO|nr:hypothetical protein J1605_006453 [Eschrichtius robustus]
MSSNECFKCGRSGHWARECPTGGGRGRGMRSRGRGGFTSDRGFQFVSSSLPDICYRCGESGHLAKDCDLQEDAINCSKTSEVNCYRCGESGHLARECTIEATA